MSLTFGLGGRVFIAFEHRSGFIMPPLGNSMHFLCIRNRKGSPRHRVSRPAFKKHIRFVLSGTIAQVALGSFSLQAIGSPSSLFWPSLDSGAPFMTMDGVPARLGRIDVTQPSSH